jgi:hypothetical protein
MEGKRKLRVESEDDEYYYEEYDFVDETFLSQDDQVMRYENRKRAEDSFVDQMPDADNQYTEVPLSMLPSEQYNNPNTADYSDNLRRKVRNKVNLKKQSNQMLISKQSRRLSMTKKPSSAPIYEIMDNIFKIDDKDINSRAADYERSIRIGTKNREYRDQKASTKRRKGYAYPLDSSDVYDQMSTNEWDSSDPGTVIDVSAISAIQSESNLPTGSKKESIDEISRQRWIDRADADERVPPKEVLAWVSSFKE